MTARLTGRDSDTDALLYGERESDGTLVYASGEGVTGKWENGQLVGG